MRFLLFLVTAATVFLLFYAALILSITLISAGLLSIPLSLMVMSGVFTHVASDLSPLTMFFVGGACLSSGLALALSVLILFPKQKVILAKYLKSRRL